MRSGWSGEQGKDHDQQQLDCDHGAAIDKHRIQQKHQAYHQCAAGIRHAGRVQPCIQVRQSRHANGASDKKDHADDSERPGDHRHQNVHQ